MAQSVERRRARSRFRGQAADLYLDALAREHGLRAAVLADEDGLPIASSGPIHARDPLSAYGAFLAARAQPRPHVGPRSVSLQLGSCTTSLTFLGQADLPWQEISSDLTRILGL